MSEIISINATARTELGTANARRIRREGLVPVVVYSHGKDAISLTVSAGDAERAIAHTGILEISCQTCGTKLTALVKEYQVHPLSNQVLHIDFHAVSADEVVDSQIPLEGIGDAVGTRSGGQLEQVLHVLEIKSKPADIPEKILVDVSALDLNQALHVKDLVLPAGVVAVSDPELIVFHVREAKAEVAAEEAAAEAPAEEKK